jgi:opacity protein-like surface antigen
MRSVKLIIAAGAATLLSQAAFAADMAIAPPPQMYAPPPVIEDFGGWYLRGDIGFSNQRVDRLNNVLDAGNTSSVQNLNFNTVNIAATRSSSAPTASPIQAASAPTATTPPRTSGSFSPTPMSISAPGGA